jgi:hypothetical protein
VDALSVYLGRLLALKGQVICCQGPDFLVMWML